MRNRRLVEIAISAAIAILLSWHYTSRRHPDEKEVSAAQDAVYEAVVHDMVTGGKGPARVSQLVFDNMVLTDRTPGDNLQTCLDGFRERLKAEGVPSVPFYNTLADKVYRLIADGWWDGPLRQDTIQDFVEKSCSSGRRSQSFHTDLPRTFVAGGSVHFEGRPIEKNGQKSFEQLFPGAAGIISFSKVGFDSTLHEAIVSTIFVCGGLCGNCMRYILKRSRGRWQVVSKQLVWVS